MNGGVKLTIKIKQPKEGELEPMFADWVINAIIILRGAAQSGKEVCKNG